MGHNVLDPTGDLRWLPAFHVAGHAVVHCAAGGKIKHVKPTADAAGHLQFVADPREPMDVLAALLAGQEAAARFLTKHVGYSLRAARSITQGGAHADLYEFRHAAHGSEITEDEARREAEKRVRRHWGRIERAARRLHVGGHLTHV